MTWKSLEKGGQYLYNILPENGTNLGVYVRMCVLRIAIGRICPTGPFKWRGFSYADEKEFYFFPIPGAKLARNTVCRCFRNIPRISVRIP